MKKSYIYSLLIGATLLTGCAKENPFDGASEATGRLLTRNLAVELSNEESVVRSGATPDVADFTVDFIKDGASEPAASYKYSEMPEIITLPVGSYKAVAVYGENAPAAWEAPYYHGESVAFDIKADEITDNVDPVTCRLSNVKVTIFIDDALRAAMSSDSKVTVKVGDEGSLEYTLADIDQQRCGFFAYVDQSNTLAATFSGNVEDYETHETKTYDNVAPGNHYRITFKLRSSDIRDPGYIDGTTVVVDATVEIVDLNYNVDDEPPLLEDDMRPTEDNNTEEPPVVDPTPAGGPVVTAEAPINIDAVNDVVEGMACILHVHSDTGILAFTVDIDSANISPLLPGVGLDTHLDLVNPGEMRPYLEDLHFPVAENVKGKTDVPFEIDSQMMELLGAYGEGMHNFILTITDAGGTTVKTLRLHTL